MVVIMPVCQQGVALNCVGSDPTLFEGNDSLKYAFA